MKLSSDSIYLYIALLTFGAWLGAKFPMLTADSAPHAVHAGVSEVIKCEARQ